MRELSGQGCRAGRVLLVSGLRRLTWYTAHAKRGRAGMDQAGVLPYFTGTTVTDAWSSYLGYGTAGALCNAHILRDLGGGQHAAREPRRARRPTGRTICPGRR
ncbi:IS66 family transposase [Streptomyces avermitilis]|uniref:IS66 family transposase n=1 Tax=Streptomyces avermitilis TaxID=33903 RepID=UPI0033BE6981